MIKLHSYKTTSNSELLEVLLELEKLDYKWRAGQEPTAKEMLNVLYDKDIYVDILPEAKNITYHDAEDPGDYSHIFSFTVTGTKADFLKVAEEGEASPKKSASDNDRPKVILVTTKDLSIKKAVEVGEAEGLSAVMPPSLAEAMGYEAIIFDEEDKAIAFESTANEFKFGFNHDAYNLIEVESKEELKKALNSFKNPVSGNEGFTHTFVEKEDIEEVLSKLPLKWRRGEEASDPQVLEDIYNDLRVSGTNTVVLTTIRGKLAYGTGGNGLPNSTLVSLDEFLSSLLLH